MPYLQTHPVFLVLSATFICYLKAIQKAYRHVLKGSGPLSMAVQCQQNTSVIDMNLYITICYSAVNSYFALPSREMVFFLVQSTLL